MKLTPTQLIDKFNSLKSDRGVWESHWQEIIDYFFPERMDITVRGAPGTKRRNHIFDSTGPHSMELLVSALFSMLTPPQSKWLEFTTGIDALDEDDNVRMFLQATSKKFINLLNGSNFKLAIQELYADLATIGTAAMAIERDDKMDVRFTVYPISGYVVDEDNKGMVNEIYRQFKWNAKKLVAEFGLENLSEKVQKAYNDGKSEEFEVIHGVYPSDIGMEVSDTKKDFISQYVLVNDKYEIKEEGFLEFPFIVPRWIKMAGEIYGRSPAMTALPEVKMINQMEKVVIMGAQKTIDPPLAITDDGALTRPDTTPAGLNYLRPGAEIKPILNDARIDFGVQMTDRTRTRIRECFFADQLQLQQGPQMTAYEAARRVERQMQFLGPIIARMEDEALVPMTDRIYGIMRLLGIVKDSEVPPILSKMRITPRFISTIARAQKASDLDAIEKSVQIAAPFIQSDPSVMDNIDGDAAIRIIAKTQGMDERLIRREEDVAVIRKNRAVVAMQQHQLEMQTKQADIASKTGNAIAQVQATAPQ